MNREVKLSLLVLILLVFSVLLLGFVGFSCEIWSHAAPSSAKNVGSKIVLRVIRSKSIFFSIAFLRERNNRPGA